MTPKRKSLPVDVRSLVLHESGYKCGNPVCRSILTLEIHHLVPLAKDGDDEPDNLLALCPNCHALHHKGEIPISSIRAWKLLQLAINEAYDKRTMDLLNTLDKVGLIFVSGDGLLICSTIVAADLVDVQTWGAQMMTMERGFEVPYYRLSLTARGKALLEANKLGDQRAALAATSGIASMSVN
jgi:hypothetical protein